MLTLSAAEVASFTEVNRLCLSPGGVSDDESFSALLVSAFRSLLCADRGLLVRANRSGSATVYGSGFSRSEIEVYRAVYPRDQGANLVQARGTEVWNHRDLIGESPDVFFGTWIYNEYYRPMGLEDGIGYVVAAPDDSVTILKLHNDRFGDPSFGDRGLQILSLALPSFKAALWYRSRFAQERTKLDAVVDFLSVGVLIFSEDGRLLHANPAFGALLNRDSEREQVETASRTLAGLISNAVSRRTPKLPGSGAISFEVVTAVATYQVRGFRFGEDELARSPTVVVAVERATPSPPTDLQLSDLYRLTCRECEIARRLVTVQRLTDIAQDLHISTTTLRHHTESIYRKVGVHSRAELIAVLQSLGVTEVVGDDARVAR